MASYDDTATVSGSVVSIENGADAVPTKSLVVTIPPTLSGVSSVTETQTGKNLFNDKSLNVGLPATSIGSSIDTINTSATRYTYNGFIPPNGNIAIKGSRNDTNVVATCLFFGYSGGYLTEYRSINPYGNSAVIVDCSAFDYVRLSIGANSGYQAPTDMTAYGYVQAEYGSTAHDYEPYQTPTVYTANLGRTIYGGQADIVNGVGSSGYALFTKNTADMNNSESYPGWKDQGVRAICGGGLNQEYEDGVTSSGNGYGINTLGSSNDILYLPKSMHDNKTQSDWIALAIDITFVIPLATPESFTFDGQEIPTRLGYNAFWSDSGDTELTYYKSGYGFTSVTVNKTGKNLISVPIFTPSTPTLCFDAGRDITVSNITMSFLATNAVVHATNAAIVDYRKEDGTHTYRTLNWFRDANNNQFTANTPQNGKFKNSDSNITFRYIYIYYESISYSQFESDCISEWQIELASTASDYTPYEAVTKTAKLHKVIYGGQADVVRGTCEPKNLLELYLARTSHLGINFSLTDEGLLHMEGTNTSATSSAFSGGNYSTYDACPWKFPAGTYTASSLITADNDKVGSVNFLIITKTNNVKYSYALKDAPKTFTINDDFGAWFWASVLKTETVNCDVGVQLENGSTASDFAPHFDPFTFPPIGMETDEGENTLFANEGDSAITYRKAVD